MSILDRVLPRMATAAWFRRVGPKVVPPIDRALSRLTGGRATMSGFYIPTLLLTTTGRRSGAPRTVPLAFIPVDGTRYVVASNFGRGSHPAWSENLLADPDATIETRGRTVVVRAELLGPAEKAAVWPRLLERWPAYDRYREISGRDLRVFALWERDGTPPV